MTSAQRHWRAFAATIIAAFSLLAWAAYSPNQDFISAIPLGHDGSWYSNYELSFEIQDNDVFFHGIGSSIEHAQQADIIFLGTSRVLFGLDWRLFQNFADTHHLKMFNMAFAGVTGGEFTLRVIRKWNLHPKLWVIDLFALHDVDSMKTSFFYSGSDDSDNFGEAAVANVVHYGRLTSYKNVIFRDLRWRAKMAMGLLKIDPYRSAVTGNWYLDNWPNHESTTNAKIKSAVGTQCASPLDEVAAAKAYTAEIGGRILITQIPSAFSCDRRVRDVAAALGTAAFTVDDPTQFSTLDGGGHLDGVSARKYTAAFFGWLQRQPEFQSLDIKTADVVGP